MNAYTKAIDKLKNKYPKTTKIAEKVAMPVAHQVIKSPLGQSISSKVGGGDFFNKSYRKYDIDEVKKKTDRGVPIRKAISNNVSNKYFNMGAGASSGVSKIGSDAIKKKLVEGISKSRSTQGIARGIRSLHVGTPKDKAIKIAKGINKKFTNITKSHKVADPKSVGKYIAGKLKK